MRAAAEQAADNMAIRALAELAATAAVRMVVRIRAATVRQQQRTQAAEAAVAVPMTIALLVMAEQAAPALS